jgi:cell division septum initiation protein DivIVA
MNENRDLLPNLLHEEFEMQMRGYSRRQVEDYVARRNAEIRELEQRLARALDETEHLRREVATVRQQALAGRPAHEEVSERISQILKLADDEARAQKVKADDDIAKQRSDAQQESERVRADAREQAERMLTAAQEQAERTISAARSEADKTRSAARTEADRLTNETRKKADAALAGSKAQAKKVLDEATARATAIHDGAERRLNVLSTRHGETVRRLADILDGEQAEQAANGNGNGGAPSRNNEDLTPADLALLAPPAPETAAGGAPAPVRHGGGRPAPAQHESPALGGPSLPPPPPPPQSMPGGFPPPMPPRPSQVLGGPPMNGPALVGPPLGGPSLPGPGLPPPPPGLHQERDFDPRRDPFSSTGAIDPDEPTEGIRLMP